MCKQHGLHIRQVLETKIQHLFEQIREEYDHQCSPLLTNIEREINEMKQILQEITSNFDSTTIESMSSLTKQAQRLNVLSKNLEYDWQIITQTSRRNIFMS